MMRTKDLTLMGILLALLIICSQFSLPIGPVPITLQTFAVLLIGMILQPKQALMVTGLYALIGLVGLPVFSGYTGGLGSFLKPSFGFVISFIVASAVIALIIRKTGRTWVNYLVAGIVGTIVIYAIGVPYLGYILNNVMDLGKSVSEILKTGMIPFLFGDALKVVVASGMAVALEKPILRFNRA